MFLLTVVLTACAGLSLTESLSAFDWTCDATGGSARFIFTGLKNAKALADLLDFTAVGWRQNAETVYLNGAAWGAAPNAQWWSNPVALCNDGGSLSVAGTIYLVTNDQLTAGYALGADGVALVAQPGIVIDWPTAVATSKVVDVPFVDFVWIEGQIDAANAGYGVFLNNVRFSHLRNVEADNAVHDGIHLITASNNRFSRLTALYNQVGVYIIDSTNNNFSDTLSVSGNNSDGLFLSAASSNSFQAVSAFSNGAAGVDFYATADYNSFQEISASADSYVGKLLTDDTSNAADTSGAVSSPAGLSYLGWSIFANPFRAWGGEGATYPAADHRGRWTTGAGRIWDWSLAAADGTIRIAFPVALPTGNDTLTHTWSDNSTTTFLQRAVEIQGDSIGNDNTLCESGETCLHTPNLGSYQGHGNLVSAGTFSNGTLTGIALRKYEANGR